MDLKNLFSKIVSGNKGSNTPQAIKDAFNNQFNNPLNTEWLKTENYFEAVFYKDEQEHIARYRPNGELISLKINLPLNTISKQVSDPALGHGELMNAIAIHCQDTIKYEFIVRDKNLDRYFILLDSNGEVLEKEKL